MMRVLLLLVVALAPAALADDGFGDLDELDSSPGFGGLDEESGSSPGFDVAEMAASTEFEFTGEMMPLGEAPDIRDENGEEYAHIRADVQFPPNYRGCFQDHAKRDLKRARSSSPKMTPQLCVKFCNKRKFKFAGVQYYQECSCDNDFGRYGRLPEERCNTPCKGDGRKKCGGAWANSVYATSRGQRFPFQGCYLDRPQRTLPAAVVMHKNDVMNRKYCCNLCGQTGYKYCGTEYAYECFCGNKLPGQKLKRRLGECAEPCSGNRGPCNREMCGDQWRLSIYTTGRGSLEDDEWAWTYADYGTSAAGAGALAVLALVGWRAYRQRRGGDDDDDAYHQVGKQQEAVPLL